MEELPVKLTKCDDEIPLLGVTRQFDFGQFIELFDATGEDALPARVVVGKQEAPFRDVVEMAPRSSLGARGTSQAPIATVDLFDLLDRGPFAKREPVRVEVLPPELERFLADPRLTIGETPYRLAIDDDMVSRLRRGEPIVAAGLAGDSWSRPFLLTLGRRSVALTQHEVESVIATRSVGQLPGRIQITAAVVRALLSGQPVDTLHEHDGRLEPIRIQPPSAALAPRSGEFEVADLPSFLADPQVPAVGGATVPLDLTPNAVHTLLRDGKVTVEVHGCRTGVEVRLPPALRSGPRCHDSPDPCAPSNGGGSFGTASAYVAFGALSAVQESTPVRVERYVPREPLSAITSITPTTGPGELSIGVFVPWRQTWSLVGFSRGNLLHSMALTPGEEVTMQIFSWERRTRTLEQVGETESEQQSEWAFSTKDTDDVLKEMVSKSDLSWQLSGSLDASYNTLVAQISVAVNGSLDNSESLVQTTRTSHQNITESTLKASSRVRSRRTTKVAQGFDSGREDRISRIIRNPNSCHTVTYDFFETLAHYDVQLKFLKDKVRLIGLIRNPSYRKDFGPDVILRNETSLRNALLEPAAMDGFDACKTVAAYNLALDIVTRQAQRAADQESLESQRSGPKPTATPSPSSPQEAALRKLGEDIATIVRDLHPQRDLSAAVGQIRSGAPVGDTERRHAQIWLFFALVRAYFPSLMVELERIAAANPAPAGLDVALRLVPLLPSDSSPVRIDNLAQLSNREKEDAALAVPIWTVANTSISWAWWTGKFVEEQLYSPLDGGLGGQFGELRRAHASWRMKAGQGEAIKTETELGATDQDKDSIDDKLATAFPLDELARAQERMQVLQAHLQMHPDYYSYVLFQSLPPSEQALAILVQSAGRLQVGLFEPRAIGMVGSKLAIPLTPLASTPKMAELVKSIANSLGTAFADVAEQSERVILPTPGVSVATRLGACTGCEEYIEKARHIELERLQAIAKQETLEARRREARLKANELDEFVSHCCDDSEARPAA